jgi:hypothetical protein
MAVQPVSRCEGLHCRGCRDGGSGKAVLAGGGIVAGVLAAEWVAAHAWEVLAVTAVCGALAVAAVVALLRWAQRRDARHAAGMPFLTVREVPGTGTPVTGSGTRAPIPGTSAEQLALGFRELHIHLDGQPTAEQAEVIRQALHRRPGS